MTGQTLAQCIVKCVHICGMRGQELANCIQMMLGVK